jgi:(2Fe-2S) ferredoxin
MSNYKYSEVNEEEAKKIVFDNIEKGKKFAVQNM